MTYLERFKSEINVVQTLVGKKFLDEFIKQKEKYEKAPNSVVLTATQKDGMYVTLKSTARDSFYALLFLKGAKQTSFGGLLPEYCQAYANGKRDLYPKNPVDMFELMKIVPIPKEKKKLGEVRKKEEDLESSFI